MEWTESSVALGILQAESEMIAPVLWQWTSTKINWVTTGRHLHFLLFHLFESEWELRVLIVFLLYIIIWDSRLAMRIFVFFMAYLTKVKSVQTNQELTLIFSLSRMILQLNTKTGIFKKDNLWCLLSVYIYRF